MNGDDSPSRIARKADVMTPDIPNEDRRHGPSEEQLYNALNDLRTEMREAFRDLNASFSEMRMNAVTHAEMQLALKVSEEDRARLAARLQQAEEDIRARVTCEEHNEVKATASAAAQKVNYIIGALILVTTLMPLITLMVQRMLSGHW